MVAACVGRRAGEARVVNEPLRESDDKTLEGVDQTQNADVPDEVRPAPRVISEVPILTYQARLGSRIQFVSGLLLIFTWFGGGPAQPWPWEPVAHGDINDWPRAALPAAGFLLVLTTRSGVRLRMCLLALVAFAGLWQAGGAVWGPVPNWFLGGRWAETAPYWCFLLTPAFAFLVGGTLGADGDASRVRVWALAASAVAVLAFFVWPVGDRGLQQMLFDEVHGALRTSYVLGWSLAALWVSGVLIPIGCGLAALGRKFDARVHSFCSRLIIAFVFALIVSRLAFAGEAQDGSVLRAFLLLLHAFAVTLRELAIAASLALLVALGFEWHERRRTTGWEQAF